MPSARIGREELLDQAARIAPAALGGDLAKVLEHVPPGASDFLGTAGAGWTPADSAVGILRIPDGSDASPTGRAEATGRGYPRIADAQHVMVRDRRPRAVLNYKMIIFRVATRSMQDGWTRALSAPMTGTGVSAVVLLGLTLMMLRFFGLG
jgi:hypothetical protein